MAMRMKPVDVVLVGMGFTSAILVKELADAGLSVVGIERGIWCDTIPDFQSPAMHDERRYAVRGDLFQNMAIEAMTFRNTPDQEALPMRSLGSFLPGTDVGGAGVHWNGQTWRFLPSDFVQRSHYLEKYGPNAIPEELTIQDWRVTYKALSYPTVELRTRVHVTRGLLDSERKRATAVLYVDGEGQEVGQPYNPATGQGTVGALAYWSA
jgi:gluconate 2-dehydrogenase alpha chain